MTLLKHALKNMKKDIAAHLLSLLQLTAAIVITVIMVSTTLLRYRYYAPFKDVFKANGFICSFPMFGSSDDTGMMDPEKYIADEELRDILPDADKIISCNLGPSWLVDENGDPLDLKYSIIYYDDDIIERYKPKLEDGRWMNTSRNARCIEGVVTENNSQVKVGDILRLQCFSKTTEDMFQEVLIVGKIPENTKIIGYSKGEKAKDADIRLLYGTASYAVEEEFVLILSSNYLSENTTVCQGIFGPAIVTFPDDYPPEKLELAGKKLSEINGQLSYHLSKADENTHKYIFEHLTDLLPIVIVLLIMIMVSAISSSALTVRREIRNFAIFYISGLQWKHCCLISLIQAVVISVLSLIMSLAVVLILNNLNSSVISITFVFGTGTFICAAGVVLFFIIISLVMPAAMLTKTQPREVLTR